MSPGLTKKLILATLLFLFMIFPIYRFILKLSSRKYTIKEYELEKKKIKEESNNLLNLHYNSFFFSI